ncbi:MAG: hypothetical protein AVDCRST_MAG59-2850, partial [uncultured Thermomicrobiales bacterium]
EAAHRPQPDDPGARAPAAGGGGGGDARLPVRRPAQPDRRRRRARLEATDRGDRRAGAGARGRRLARAAAVRASL